DDPAVLGELMRALVECRIKPYYLHHGDLAPGTAHWRTSIEEGQALMRALHGRLSGLCQPAYVLDIPGGHGKSPIGPSYVARIGGENGTARHAVEDFRGWRHLYPPRSRYLEPRRPSHPPGPDAAAAPHFAAVAAIEIIKHRDGAAGVPVPGKKRNPLARHPSVTGRRSRGKARAVDDEIAAPGGLHDFDDVALGRQVEPLRIVSLGCVVHAVGKRRRAHQRSQGERRYRFQHF